MIVDDNFGGYPIGFQFLGGGGMTPGVWYKTNGPATIVGGMGALPGLDPDHNYAPPADQAVVLGAIDQLIPVPIPPAGGLIGFSYYYGGELIPGADIMHCNLFTLHDPAPPPPPPPPFSGFLFAISIDYTGSLILSTQLGVMSDPDSGLSSSMLQTGKILEPDSWNYIQAVFNIVGSTIPGGIPGVVFSIAGLSVSINGVVVVKGSRNTGILYSAAPGVNSLGFGGAGGGVGATLLTNVTFDESGSAGYPYPAVAPLPLGRVSQIPMQWMKKSTDLNARVSQIPIQYLKYPTYENMRVSQIVIQVMKGKGGGGGGGVNSWKVSES